MSSYYIPTTFVNLYYIFITANDMMFETSKHVPKSEKRCVFKVNLTEFSLK